MRRMLDEKDVKDISLETIEQKNLKPVSGTVENDKWKTITIGTETHGFAGGGGGGDAVWGDITGDIADQTDLKNALDAKADSADLATVATTGDYDDLSNKPTIPTVIPNDGKTIIVNDGKLETAIGGWHESGPGVDAFDDDNTGYKSNTEPEFEIDSTGYDGPCELFKDVLGLNELEPNVFSDYNYSVEVKQNGTTIWLHEACPIAWNAAGPSGSVAILINKASSTDRISLNNVPSVDANTFRAKVYPQNSGTAVNFNSTDVVTLTIKKLATNIYHKINPSYIPIDSSTLRVNQSGQITVTFPSDFVTTYGNQSINGVKTILSSIGGKLQFKNWYSEDGLSYWQQLQDCSLVPGKENTTHTIGANYIGDPLSQNKTISTIYFDKDASYNLKAGNDTVKIADIATAISEASTAVQPADLAAVATTGDYDDLTNKPTIPDAVSGTNDGTNWLTLTIGSDTYGIGGGSAPSNMVTTDTAQDITGLKTFVNNNGIYIKSADSNTGRIWFKDQYANNIGSINVNSNNTSTQGSAQNYVTIEANNSYYGKYGIQVSHLYGYDGKTYLHASNSSHQLCLGSPSNQIDNIYIKGTSLSGGITDGTDTVNRFEQWTFVLSDNTTVTKTVIVG